MSQEVLISLIPFWATIVPLLAGVAIFLTGIRPGRYFPSVEYDGLLEKSTEPSPPPLAGVLRNLFLLAGTIIPLALVLYMYPIVRQGTVVVGKIDVLPPLGLNFQVDILSLYMGLLFAFFGLIIVIYSIGYMKDEPLPQRFFGFMMLVYGGSIGVVLAGDLFSLFLFFEFMSIMYFVLVVHHATAEQVAAGVKFLFMTILAGVALFLAVVITFRDTGSLALDTPGLFNDITSFSLLAFLGFMIAFGTKSAMFPLHFWAPDAYTFAPMPAGLISSAIMLKTGIYGFIRVFYNVFGVEFWETVVWDNILIVVAAFTILFGSTIAIAQDDILRRLAYSGIAQMGYIILGIVILTPYALTGAVFHITAHAFMKGGMFLCAGSIIKGTGTRSIRNMKGIGYQLPITMLAFTVTAITSVGIPPFNLFITKWHLSLGALEIGQPVLVLILLISSLLNAAYYLPIAYNAFLGESADGADIHHRDFKVSNFKEPSAMMLVPIIILTIGCFIFGLPVYNLPLDIVQSITGMFYGL